jgi:hypothetical protein
LEDEGSVGLTLTSIVIILLIYDVDIVLMEKSPYDLGKKLIIVKYLFSIMDMTMNTSQVIIIKSKIIAYDAFVYDNNSLEELPSYNYLGIYIHHNINWNYSLEKMINGGWKAYYGT